jgi:membrane-associated protease RseP (regulator of RpoE activity)
MNTYLGASVHFGPDDVDPSVVLSGKVLYLEGYLFDAPEAQQAFRTAARYANEGGVKVAVTLSDGFCVDRHRDAFQDLIEVIQVRGGAPTDFVLERNGDTVRLTATPEWRRSESEPGAPRVGRLGLGPTGEVVRQAYGPLEAVAKGVDRTWRVLTTSVYAMGRMITGQMSAEQLNGPLGIAQMSGQGLYPQGFLKHGVGIPELVECLLTPLTELQLPFVRRGCVGR